jgi:hypothetical protein
MYAVESHDYSLQSILIKAQTRMNAAFAKACERAASFIRYQNNRELYASTDASLDLFISFHRFL